jgi:hypothetical protein
VPFGFEDEDDNEAEDDQQQQEYAFALSCALLVSIVTYELSVYERDDKLRSKLPCRNFELLDGVLHLHGRLLDIVLDAVEQRALIDNEHREILEQLCKGRDRVGNFGQLLVPSAEVL